MTTQALWLCWDCLQVAPETTAMRAQFENWWLAERRPPWPSLLYCPTCESGKLTESEDDCTRAVALATVGVGGIWERFEAARAAGYGYMLSDPSVLAERLGQGSKPAEDKQ